MDINIDNSREDGYIRHHAGQFHSLHHVLDLLHARVKTEGLEPHLRVSLSGLASSAIVSFNVGRPTASVT
jgi:hypothetical protein